MSQSKLLFVNLIGYRTYSMISRLKDIISLFMILRNKKFHDVFFLAICL